MAAILRGSGCLPLKMAAVTMAKVVQFFFAQRLSFIRHTFYSISLSEWSLNYSLDAVNVKMVVVESGSWLDAMS